MIENDFRQADLDLGLQALFLGNVSSDLPTAASGNNLFVIGTRPNTASNYTSRLHLTDTGDLFVGRDVTIPPDAKKLQTKEAMSSYVSTTTTRAETDIVAQHLSTYEHRSGFNFDELKVSTSWEGGSTEKFIFQSHNDCKSIMFKDHSRSDMLEINVTDDEVRVWAPTLTMGNGATTKLTHTQLNTQNVVATGYINAGGSIVADGDITAFSDIRLKKDIKTLDGKKVLDMRGVEFIKDGEKRSGVIAQELEKVAPELVVDNEKYKSVAYGNIVGYLIEAIKDQQKQIDYLTEVLENGTSK